MDLDENPQPPSSIEVITKLFSSMNVSLYSDTFIEAELQKGNLSDDDAIKYVLALINSSDTNQQLIGARIIRRLLSKENDIPYAKIINTNILPALIQLIPNSDENFSYEVLWIISNLAALDSFCNDYLISQRSLELINYILERTHLIETFKQIMWALGNIAGTGPNYRDIVIQQIDFTKIICFLETNENNSSIMNCATITWCIYNLLVGKPLPDLNKIKGFIPFLEKQIMNQERELILRDTLYSYGIFIGVFSEHIQSQTLVKVCSLLDCPNIKINQHCLNIIGNYATKKIDQDFVINSGLFPKIIHFIDSSDRNVRKEAYFAISNLVLDTNIYFNYLKNSNFFIKFRKTLEGDSDNVIKEAVWVICNFASVCDFEQAKWIIDSKIIDLLLEKLLINSTIGDIIFDGFCDYLKFDNLLEMEEISKYFEILEHAKNHIGNNNLKLERVLTRLNEIAKMSGWNNYAI